MARTALVAGVGPGLGASLARTFASEGCDVGLFARSEDYIEGLAERLREAGVEAVAVPTDLRDADQVRRGVEAVREELGPIEILVNHASGGGWGGVRDLSPEAFEDAWRTAAYGGFCCSTAVLPDMLDAGEGTIIFTGATSAVRGRADAAGFASAKFAVRGLAGSMARELGPLGVHVAHVVIDGGIRTPDRRGGDRDETELLDPDEIAESYWHLVEQDRSSWTLELDLRPHVEGF